MDNNLENTTESKTVETRNDSLTNDANHRLKRLETSISALQSTLATFMESVNALTVSSKSDVANLHEQIASLGERVERATSARGRNNQDNSTTELHTTISALKAEVDSAVQAQVNQAADVSKTVTDAVARLEQVSESLRNEIQAIRVDSNEQISQMVTHTHDAVQSAVNRSDAILTRLDEIELAQANNVEVLRSQFDRKVLRKKEEVTEE